MAIAINGTTGISGVDGSASAPALQGSDSNTGVSFGTDTVNINTGGTTRATIDSSGNVGIGTTSPDHGRLTLSQSASSAFNALVIQQGNTGSSATDGLHIGIDSNVDAYIFHKESRALEFGTANTERMRITSSGLLLLNTPNSLDDQYRLHTFITGTGGHVFRPDGTSTRKPLAFQNNNGSEVGSISNTTTATSYNTSSDYRLKENVTAISDGITRLKTLKPSRFNFIANAETTVDGFLAHEVTAVPEAVTGTKDEVDSDNNPVYQGIDQSKLVPLLTAALQEAVAKIEVLETKVAALEAA